MAVLARLQWMVVGIGAVCVLAGGGALARASGPDETVPPVAVLQTMEQKADAAAARDQCFLYTQLLHALTEMEGQQVGSGDAGAAGATLSRMERVTAKMKAAESKDAKKMKDAEKLMEHSTQRLGDMLHLASGEEHAAMKATLDHMNKVHDDILGLVFAQ